MEPTSAYSFIPTSGYSLELHEVSFKGGRITVKLKTTAGNVYSEDYAAGIAFRCAGNEFQIGTLNAPQVFVRQVDLALRKSQLWLKPKNIISNAFVGSNDSTDTGIYNIYNLNECPVLLCRNGVIAEIKCPCTNESGACSNTCYQYGNGVGYENPDTEPWEPMIP